MAKINIWMEGRAYRYTSMPTSGRWYEKATQSKKPLIIPDRVEGKPIFRYRWVSCKTWRCPFCGRRNKCELTAAISAQASALNLRYFVTLTFNPDRLLDSSATRNATKRWQHFMKALKRQLGSRPLYIRVLDAHRSGELHIHALLSECPSLRWLRRNLRAKPHGSDVHVRATSFETAPGYMTKCVRNLPRRAHPYGKSRVIEMLPKRKKKAAVRWTPVRIEKLRRLAGSRVIEEKHSRNGLVYEFTTKQEIPLRSNASKKHPKLNNSMDRGPGKEPHRPTDHLKTIGEGISTQKGGPGRSTDR